MLIQCLLRTPWGYPCPYLSIHALYCCFPTFRTQRISLPYTLLHCLSKGEYI